MKKIIILIIMLAVLGIGLVYYMNQNKSQAPEGDNNQGGSVLTPTGDIDDTVDALLSETDEESAAIGDGQTEKDLIISDSQQASDFGQSADENEF